MFVIVKKDENGSVIHVLANNLKEIKRVIISEPRNFIVGIYFLYTLDDLLYKNNYGE